MWYIDVLFVGTVSAVVEPTVCEAFGAKYHPNTSIATRLQDDLPQTNRFFDNLFDFQPPTTPRNLKSTDIDLNFVDITFNHATDNVNVDKYLVYQQTRNGS